MRFPQGRIYPCDRMVRQDDNPDYVLGEVATGLDEARVCAVRERHRTADPECVACDLGHRSPVLGCGYHGCSAISALMRAR